MDRNGHISRSSGGAYQAAYSLILLGSLVTTCVVADLIARNRALETWLMAQSSILAGKNDTLFSYTGNFIDFEERLVLDELPHTNFSQGGVYFFGTSNMKWAFTTWDLPPEQKRFIGNYGIGASNHTELLALIRYLIAQYGFLGAGKKDLVLFGVSFHLGHMNAAPGASFFAGVLRRQGLFNITPSGAIVSQQMPAIVRWLRIEKARSAGLLWDVGRVIKGWFELYAGWNQRGIHNPSQYRQAWREYMGPDWRDNIDKEVEDFRTTIQLLQSYQAEVKVILLPQGTWMDKLPFTQYYDTKIRALCDATSTPIIDLSRSIPDNEFVDSNHLTTKGQTHLRDLFLPEITNHLRRIRPSEPSEPG